MTNHKSAECESHAPLILEFEGDDPEKVEELRTYLSEVIWDALYEGMQGSPVFNDDGDTDGTIKVWGCTVRCVEDADD